MTNKQDQERQWESVATHEEIRARYAERVRRRMVRRRFRVEGTAAGNSYLLTKSRARETQNQWGGAIVEVIPFTPLAQRQAQGMPECPTCKAKPGKPCTTKPRLLDKSQERVPHASRWEAHHEDQESAVAGVSP